MTSLQIFIAGMMTTVAWNLFVAYSLLNAIGLFDRDGSYEMTRTRFLLVAGIFLCAVVGDILLIGVAIGAINLR